MITFFTVKQTGDYININEISTTTGYFSYFESGGATVVLEHGSDIQIQITSTDTSKRFDIESCDEDGNTYGSMVNLNLSSNSLTNVLGNFQNVVNLDLSTNLISDGKLSLADGVGNLLHLDLSDNELSTFADGYFNLTSLTELYISGNSLTYFSLPTTIANSLQILNLSGNQLTIFDTSEFGSLSILNLSGNQLDGLDTSSLESLINLNLSDNLFESISFGSELPLQVLNLSDNQLTSFDGTNLTSLTELELSVNQLTSEVGSVFPSSLISLNIGGPKDGVGTLQTFDASSLELINLEDLDLTNNQLTSFTGGDNLLSLTNLYLGKNQLTSFDGSGQMSWLNKLYLNDNLFTQFEYGKLTALSELDLTNNQLESININNLVLLNRLTISGNPLINTTSINDLLLALLAANELTNDWNDGMFTTSGGRTVDGTGDYNYLIANGWEITGAGLLSWYRFKAPSTQPWDGTIGVDSNQNIKEVWLYKSNEFFYYDFLTSESIGEVKFNIQGTETEIIATQVPVTFNEFNSSGSFTAGIALGGQAIGYADTTAFGSWGTLNYATGGPGGDLPAIPSRYEGDVPAGSIIFSEINTTEGTNCVITAPILMALTVSSYSIGDLTIDLTGVNGGANGTYISPLGFSEGDEVTFSITWGELVETLTARKLRVRGITQQN